MPLSVPVPGSETVHIASMRQAGVIICNAQMMGKTLAGSCRPYRMAAFVRWIPRVSPGAIFIAFLREAR